MNTQDVSPQAEMVEIATEIKNQVARFFELQAETSMPYNSDAMTDIMATVYAPGDCQTASRAIQNLIACNEASSL